MATETTEIKLLDETLSSLETNNEDYAHSTTSISISPAGSDDTTLAEGGVTQRDSFLPTAEHAEQPSQEQVFLSAELVAGEVDCKARSVKSKENAQNTPVSDTSSPAPGRRTMKLEDKNCSCCNIQFERHGRSFNRRAVFTFTTPETVRWAFPDAAVHRKSFLCETCAQSIRSKCRRRQSGKRFLWLRPAVSKQTQPEMEERRTNGCRMGKKSKAALLVSKSCYKAAFKLLWSAKGARKPMMDFWSKQLNEEMKVLRRQPDNPFHQKVSSQKPLTSFPWRRCLNWAQLKAPLVTTCLTSLFPSISALSKSSHGQMPEEQAQMLLERRTVVALSIPLFTRNIWKNNFLQASLGAELRSQGCSGAALDALNTLGLCQNKDTVRLLLHRLQNSKTSTDTGEHRMKMAPDQILDAKEEDERGDKEVSTEEEDTDQEDQGLGGNAEMDESLEEAVRKPKKVQQKEAEEEEEGPKRRRLVVLRLDLLKGHSEVGQSDLSASDLF